MTKLTEWLCVVSVLGAIWVAVLTGRLFPGLAKDNFLFVAASPVLLVVLFGLYALTLLVYRVATFNDCDKAAEELREEIEAAKRDLRKKGLALDSNATFCDVNGTK